MLFDSIRDVDVDSSQDQFAIAGHSGGSKLYSFWLGQISRPRAFFVRLEVRTSSALACWTPCSAAVTRIVTSLAVACHKNQIRLGHALFLLFSAISLRCHIQASNALTLAGMAIAPFLPPASFSSVPFNIIRVWYRVVSRCRTKVSLLSLSSASYKSLMEVPAMCE